MQTLGFVGVLPQMCRLVSSRSNYQETLAGDEAAVTASTAAPCVRALRSGASLGSGMPGLMPMIPQQQQHDEEAALDCEMAAIDAAINAEMDEQPDAEEPPQRHKKRVRSTSAADLLNSGVMVTGFRTTLQQIPPDRPSLSHPIHSWGYVHGVHAFPRSNRLTYWCAASRLGGLSSIRVTPTRRI